MCGGVAVAEGIVKDILVKIGVIERANRIGSEPATKDRMVISFAKVDKSAFGVVALPGIGVGNSSAQVNAKGIAEFSRHTAEVAGSTSNRIVSWTSTMGKYGCPDPACGLASIEAIYLARLILGSPVDGILDQYYWRDEFLRLNIH